MKSLGERTCLVCGASMRKAFIKNGYQLVVCPSCGLLSTNLNVDYGSFVKSFYQKGYFSGDVAFGAYHSYEHDHIYIRRNMHTILSKIRSVTPPPARILDVGCAAGYFVEQALDEGYDAWGVDPSQYAITLAPDRIRKRLKLATIESAKFPDTQFDVVTMLDVFEHVENPRQTLRKVRSLLADEGYVVIATGNTDSRTAKILDEHWTFFAPPQHLHFFNRKNMGRILVEEKFEPVRWLTMGKWLSLGYVLHLAMSSGNYPFVWRLKPFIQKTGLDRFPLYLPMRDNMIVIARKVG